jgi:hypothetical protein
MLSHAPYARPHTPAPALFAFPSLCLPLSRAARRRQRRCAALLPRRGTQFTCFTSTKVQILAAVMCGAVAAPASVFELFCASSKARKLSSKTCCGACVCQELQEHRGVLSWTVPAASLRHGKLCLSPSPKKCLHRAPRGKIM